MTMETKTGAGGGYLKCIDPQARWVWQHPEMPDVRFEYRALSGPTLTRDIAARYLNDCITAAWHVSIGGVDYDEWRIETGPPVDWARVLPSDVANAVFVAIAAVSSLSAGDERDSRLPSGPPNGMQHTTAHDAAGPDGYAPGGETRQRQDGSASAGAGRAKRKRTAQLS